MDGEFTFHLYETDVTFTSHTWVETVTNKDGKFTFTSIEKPVGTYYYVIEEEVGSLGGVTYDKSHYHVVVNIVDNTTGETNAEVTIYKISTNENGTTSTKVDAVEFVNTYEAKDTDGLVLSGTKELTGRDAINGEFSFSLYSADKNYVADAKPLETVVNIDGGFTFSELTYEATGDYYYVIKEVDTKLGGVAYDAKEYKVKVTVTDDGKGELVAKVVSVNGSTSNLAIVFNNTYEINDEEAIVIEGVKTLFGREWLATDAFTFELYNADSAYNAVGDVLQTKVVKGTDAVKAFAFDEITYTEVGTHYYVVKEQVGSIDGVTYDETVYGVKVVVTDNLDGTLSVVKSYYQGNAEVDTIAFSNIYEVHSDAETSVIIHGMKTLTGRTLQDGEFTFVLSDEAGNVIETVNNYDNFAFSAITYGKEDINKTFTYKVSEKADADDNGITYDTTVYTVTVKVVDNGDATLGTVVKYYANEQEVSGLTFENDYTITPTPFAITGTKVLTGRELVDGEFVFELYEASDVTLSHRELVATVMNKDGQFEFAGLEKDPGTYYYVIHEKVGDLGGITYDLSHYNVTVVIADDGNGGTKVDSTTITKAEVTEQGTEIVSTDEIVFNNTYTSKDTDGLVISGTKVLEGRKLINAEFVFELYDVFGNVIQTTVVKDGQFTFAELTYEQAGTYYYTVKEQNTNLGGVTYDDEVFFVKVVVTDNGQGELNAEIAEMKTADHKTVSELVFTNTYEVTPVTDVITGTKVLTGRDWKDTDEFTFALYQTESDYVVGSEAIATATVTSTAQTFAFAEMEFDAEGVYYYVVKEVAGTIAGINYDTTVYNIKVTVTDNLDGTFKVEKEIYVDDAVVNAVVFENEYKVTGTSEGTGITLEAKKVLTGAGRTLVDGEFSFSLYATDADYAIKSEALETVTNKGEAVVFTEMLYEQAGTYYYVIVEEVGKDENIVYDESTYMIRVDVTDVDAQLVAEITSITKDGETVDVMQFTNKYIVNTSDTATNTNWVVAMLVSAMGLLVVLRERRKMAK